MVPALCHTALDGTYFGLYRLCDSSNINWCTTANGGTLAPHPTRFISEIQHCFVPNGA